MHFFVTFIRLMQYKYIKQHSKKNINQKHKAMKTIEKLLSKFTGDKNYSFIPEFNEIIKHKLNGYGSKKADLKIFFEDLQYGGCISGLIGDFIYNSDCKDFYIKHIDDLEDFKTELEDMIGEPIANRHNVPHYVFLCWLCFEEYCYNIYREVFEND